MRKNLYDKNEDVVIKQFIWLTKIPRCSGNEKKVIDYLVGFAKYNKLDFIQEESLNVIIKKKGTKGYENAPTVILQAHMDMLCAKEEGVEIDFDKDSIPIIVEEDIIKGKGTTLGADDGIGIAMIMAILESDKLEHPPINALFTVDEERGMEGALKINPENISGDILINLNSEEEGVITVSSAGGVNNRIHLPIGWKKIDAKKEAYKISIRGLRGGHSGLEIDKNRANAMKLLGRLLQEIDKKIGMDIFNITGGEKINAIPKMSEVKICINKNDLKELENVINKFQKIFSNEFQISDSEIKINLEKIDKVYRAFTSKIQKDLIGILRLIPNGVQTMSSNIEGLVESSNNIGVLSTKENEIIFESAVRSSVKSLKNEINDRIQVIADFTGAKMELDGDYPQWEYIEHSPIRDLMRKVYKEMYNKDSKVQAIHAGLETGLLKEKLGDIDTVSIGSNIYNGHTTEEYVSISSTKRVFKFLTEVLRRIK